MTSSAGDDGFLFAAGNHGFQFDYTLPSDLPSTFEGRWGEIKYSVKATLRRPCRFDIEREAELTVSAHVDLNEDPELAVSSSRTRTGTGSVGQWVMGQMGRHNLMDQTDQRSMGVESVTHKSLQQCSLYNSKFRTCSGTMHRYRRLQK